MSSMPDIRNQTITEELPSAQQTMQPLNMNAGNLDLKVEPMSAVDIGEGVVSTGNAMRDSEISFFRRRRNNQQTIF